MGEMRLGCRPLSLTATFRDGVHSCHFFTSVLSLQVKEELWGHRVTCPTRSYTTRNPLLKDRPRWRRPRWKMTTILADPENSWTRLGREDSHSRSWDCCHRSWHSSPLLSLERCQHRRSASQRRTRVGVPRPKRLGDQNRDPLRCGDSQRHCYLDGARGINDCIAAPRTRFSLAAERPLHLHCSSAGRATISPPRPWK